MQLARCSLRSRNAPTCLGKVLLHAGEPFGCNCPGMVLRQGPVACQFNRQMRRDQPQLLAALALSPFVAKTPARRKLLACASPPPAGHPYVFAERVRVVAIALVPWLRGPCTPPACIGRMPWRALTCSRASCSGMRRLRGGFFCNALLRKC